MTDEKPENARAAKPNENTAQIAKSKKMQAIRARRKSAPRDLAEAKAKYADLTILGAG